MKPETQEAPVELYQAYSVQEILERREMLGLGSMASLSGGYSVPV
jgi:hypothetical protein